MPRPIPAFLLHNACLVDAAQPQARPGHSVLIENGMIREISERPIKSASAVRIDLAQRILMPGLIDAHVHVAVPSKSMSRNRQLPPSLAALMCSQILHAMLLRGFTTVRDAGGADWGLAEAVERGVIDGPRLLISGRALSQTGGHGDMRMRTESRCGCSGALSGFSIIADGVDAVRHAVRENLRQGAHQIKVMASGGVLSPTDGIAQVQYGRQELCAIVETAAAADSYVMAHAYTPRAITQAVECGVRTIEHGSLIDRTTARLMSTHGTYLVPTLAVDEAIVMDSPDEEHCAHGIEQLDTIRRAAWSAIEICHAENVKLGFGSDVFGEYASVQSREFRLRAEVEKPFDIIRSATAVNAEMIGLSDEVGMISAGMKADLIVVDGNPLEDIAVLADPQRSLRGIMKGGRWVRCAL